MASRLDKLFAPFEGERDPLPIAIVRIAFFGGLAIHFFPALCHLDDSYAPGALRTDEWSHWLFVHVPTPAAPRARGAGALTMLAVVPAMVGLFTRDRRDRLRRSASTRSRASTACRCRPSRLLDAWAILLLWMICGGGDGRSRSTRSAARPSPAREPKLLASLILFQILLAVFFSGIEKLLAGWPGTNEMGVVFSLPEGLPGARLGAAPCPGSTASP